jgi:hypothetical protein
MNLTKRQHELLRAALSYVFSNIDDLNEARDEDEPYSEGEVEALAKVFNIEIR